MSDTAETYEKITDETVIQGAVNRVLTSPEFSRSKRSQELLEYLVEQCLSGQSAQISGVTIAQDVLGFDANFDPSSNPVVRVQAGRLRTSLAKYYRRSGADDDVLIYIAKGQYVPKFGKRESLSPLIPRSTKPKLYQQFITATIALTLLVIGLAILNLFDGKLNKNPKIPLLATNQVSNYPIIIILPFQNMTGNPKNDIFKQGFQHQLAADMTRFRIIRISLSNAPSAKLDLEQAQLADYAIEGAILSLEKDMDLIVRLIDLKTGSTIKQHRISRALGDDSYFNALSNISSDISAHFAGPEGELAKYSLQKIEKDFAVENHNHKDLKSFECLTIFNNFEANKSAKSFEHADKCLKHQVAEHPEDSSLLAALAWISSYSSPETGTFNNGNIGGEFSLDASLDLAEKAVALGPENNMAYEYLALIQWGMGNQDRAVQSMRRAVQINPTNPLALSNLGHFLYVTGEEEKGLLAVNEAIARHPNPPYWFYTDLFLKAVMDGNAENAVEFAKKHEGISSQDKDVYVLIAASLANDQEKIKTLKPEIESYAKSRGGDPLHNARRWIQSPEILNALEKELNKVGIETPKYSP